ncbi:SsrA-binding protein SmpB [Patescibacteria group bacterium]|nr:SsrA-binding protein SmpB [Patescibacteria group bacterium]
MLLAKNRKALFNYEIIEKYLAGIMLTGYEVKALRERNVNFEGSFVKIENGEALLINLQIGRYSKQGQKVDETAEKRARKLLLNKVELEKITRQIQEKGKTIVPLAFVLRNNLIKLEIAVVKGRKKYEKKQVAKTRQIEKDLLRQRKDMGIRG